MNPILKNSLAVIIGIVVGSAINMGIITISGSIIPPPEGADATAIEGVIESMHLFEPKHFIFPFLAHALGTLAGAITTAFIAATHKIKLTLVIGIAFLIGGLINTYLLPAPTWYTIVDLIGAYLPMAWIGGKLINRKNND